MALSREDIKKKFTELLTLANPEKQAQASELLTELSDEFESVLTESEQTATRVQELTANNETLRDVNAKLFLKVGSPAKPQEDPKPPTTEQPEDIPKFENLFGDTGELL